MVEEAYSDGLKAWVTEGSSKPGILGREAVELKVKGRTFKSVGLNFYGTNADSPSKRELEFKESSRNGMGLGYDFDNPDSRFTIRDDEIDVLIGFLDGQFKQQGFYVRTDSRNLAKLLAEKINDAALGEDLVHQLLANIGDNPDLVQAVAGSDQAALLTRLIEHERHVRAIDELERLSLDPDTVEGGFQKHLEQNPWLFGGQVVGIEKRRQLVMLDQLDLPLITSDGSLHIVELKRANIPRLFKDFRNHVILGDDVHHAVSQAQNYLMGLDSQAHTIESLFKIDAQRAFATVVIGHGKHATGGLDMKECQKAFRVYNSHLSRVRVMTYSQLIRNARNAIDLGVDSGTDSVS